MLIIVITGYTELLVKLEDHLSYIVKMCFSLNSYPFSLLLYQSQNCRSAFSNKVLLSSYIDLYIYLKIIAYKWLRNNLIFQVQHE